LWLCVTMMQQGGKSERLQWADGPLPRLMLTSVPSVATPLTTR
jgi:hypothetical protein